MALCKGTTKLLLPLGRQVRFYSAPAERSIPPAKQKYVPASGTYPKGFLAGSSHAGVKASNTKYDDIAMVVSETPCGGAAVFTRNIFKAAPIRSSMTTLRKHYNGVRGVVVNSGCANAVTGVQGLEDAKAMAHATDLCFDDAASDRNPQTLVMSTGVIGQKLPMDRIRPAIPKAHASLGATHQDWMRAARAICTTDTFPKLLSRTYTLPSSPGTQYTISGMTKGAGMIHPNMGTLLGIICTDANIDAGSLYTFLRRSSARSFNSISIDGDTSTNDTVALLANGAAAPTGSPPVSIPLEKRLTPNKHAGPGRERLSDDAMAFQTVLTEFMTDLAKLVVRDGEGATKFVTVRVRTDTSEVVARRVAFAIAKSSLVKTALYGKDANWGRILCAIGYAPGMIKDPSLQLRPSELDRLPDGREKLEGIIPERVSLSFVPSDGSEPLQLFTRGEPENVDEVRAKEILEMEDLEILVRLEDDGDANTMQREPREACVYTCDLSHEYVTINGDYRT